MKIKNYKRFITELNYKKEWNTIQYNKNKTELQISGTPTTGLFWLWTNYELSEFKEWDRDLGTISAYKLVNMTKDLTNLCSITKEGFRLVLIGNYIPNKSEEELERDLKQEDVLNKRIYHQFNSDESPWGSLDILKSPQNDLSRWRVSSVEISEYQVNFGFESSSLAYLWRMEFGTPVFNYWLWSE